MPGIGQAAIVARRDRANTWMAFCPARPVARRAAAIRLGSDARDPAIRVVRLALDGGLAFGLRHALFNIGGLLIGAAETTSYAVCNALVELRGDPAGHDRAGRHPCGVFDPEGFPDPGRFDSGRDLSGSLTFGLGRHAAAAIVPEIARLIPLDDRLTLRLDPIGLPEKTTFPARKEQT
ncbi:hypothetical protein [Paracoccus angustae]